MTHHPFGFDKAEDSHVFLLWQTTIMWQRIIKQALEPYDIAHAQFVIMASLMWFSIKDIEATQVLIAGHSKLDKMTISKSIKKLHQTIGIKLCSRFDLFISLHWFRVKFLK